MLFCFFWLTYHFKILLADFWLTVQSSSTSVNLKQFLFVAYADRTII